MEDKDRETRMSNSGFLPIISAYAARIGLVEEIERLLHCQVGVGISRQEYSAADLHHLERRHGPCRRERR
jgi:hypothetical protein